MGVSRGWGEGNGELALMGTVSVWENDKVLGMDGGGGCMAMCMFLMPLNFNVHLKMVKMRLSY